MPSLALTNRPNGQGITSDSGDSTSFRMGSEIAQLRPQDIFEKADGATKVWAIRITEVSNEPGVTRRLKNRQSNRDVPVHQELVRIGLLRLAEAQKAVGASTLLPGCPKPVGKDAGKQLSKWMCEKFLHRLAIKRDGMGFHFFRHSLTTWLRDANVPKDARDALTGHALSKRGSDGDYGTWSIVTLHRHLNGIVVPAAIRSIAPRQT